MAKRLWKKGESGNPRGRLPGQKTKVWALRDAILKSLEALGDEAEGGGGLEGFVKGLIEKAGKKDPVGLLRAIVSLLPREIRADLTIEDARTMFKQFEIIVLQEVTDSETRERIANRLREAANP